MAQVMGWLMSKPLMLQLPTFSARNQQVEMVVSSWREETVPKEDSSLARSELSGVLI